MNEERELPTFVPKQIEVFQERPQHDVHTGRKVALGSVLGISLTVLAVVIGGAYVIKPKIVKSVVDVFIPSPTTTTTTTTTTLRSVVRPPENSSEQHHKVASVHRVTTDTLTASESVSVDVNAVTTDVLTIHSNAASVSGTISASSTNAPTSASVPFSSPVINGVATVTESFTVGLPESVSVSVSDADGQHISLSPIALSPTS